MEDISDGKIVVECGDDENNASQQHGAKGGDSGATGSLAEASRGRIFSE